MPLRVGEGRIVVLGPSQPASLPSSQSATGMGSVRRSRGLADIAPQYVAKSGLCSASELESSRGGSIRIQHVVANSAAACAEGRSRFPKLDECAHFHYEHVEIGPVKVALVDEDDLKPLSTDLEEGKWWSLSVTSQGKTWLVRRSYENFRMLDQQLHRCIYDRKFSALTELPSECIEEQENLHKLFSSYLARFSMIAGSIINCGPVLNWLELDNRGHRLLVPDTDNCPINTPAVAAAYSVKRYTAQAPDEISFEVGDMISVIDMPPPEESIWWRGKRGFHVGFFPCECVAVIGDKVPRNLHFTSAAHTSQPSKPVLRKHGKLIAFFRSFILSRPSRRRLKQSGILKERVFGCDLGEHLLNSGHDIPMVLKCCAEFIEAHGIVDGIYRLSGITSNIQKLRNAFDEDRVPGLYEDEAILQDIHSVASLLKMYFRELPNPLCTYQLYHHFVSAVQVPQGDDTGLLRMRDAVQKLPPPHYRTLEYLMRHLARVASRGHETGMTPRNVAIVWAPNLLRCKELEVGGVAALQGVSVQAVVTEFLVRYCELIFCDKMPNINLPPQQAANNKKSRPKSLAISTPTKLLSLEEARTRALLQAVGKTEPDYIEVGGGPASLPAKYHTVIDLPVGSRKRPGSKRSPLGWKSLFGKAGRGSNHSRKESSSSGSVPVRKASTPSDLGLHSGIGKAVTESDIASNKRRLRPAKSVESLNSNTLDLTEPGVVTVSSPEDTLSPMLLRHVVCDKLNGNGHNRSVSHDSYFDLLQDQQERDKFESNLDISEIQVNFDLEESEMRIFSEDETLVSAGSGSLVSNNSPRILPGHRFTAPVAKRLSYPKLARGEDSLSSSQSADPSPKKQKTDDGLRQIVVKRSRLEEQLSSSAGEIQFIDSVSPDQMLVHAEVHPILQSPSPVSSVSQMSSSILPPSSPILPHIPHLCQRSSQRSSSGSKSHVTSPSLAEATISDNESFSLQSSELTTPETPQCGAYTPLLDVEESSPSNTTTPDMDNKYSPDTDNLDKAMTKANLEFDRHKNIGKEYERFEEKIIRLSSENICLELKNKYEIPEVTRLPELVPPKPEERKPRRVHQYENVPLHRSEPQPEPDVKMVVTMETSFDAAAAAAAATSNNRDSVASIKYEYISTESSCDSLININKTDESRLLLAGKSTNPSPVMETHRADWPTSDDKQMDLLLDIQSESPRKAAPLTQVSEAIVTDLLVDIDEATPSLKQQPTAVYIVSDLLGDIDEVTTPPTAVNIMSDLLLDIQSAMGMTLQEPLDISVEHEEEVELPSGKSVEVISDLLSDIQSVMYNQTCEKKSVEEEKEERDEDDDDDDDYYDKGVVDEEKEEEEDGRRGTEDVVISSTSDKSGAIDLLSSGDSTGDVDSSVRIDESESCIAHDSFHCNQSVRAVSSHRPDSGQSNKIISDLLFDIQSAIMEQNVNESKPSSFDIESSFGNVTSNRVQSDILPSDISDLEIPVVEGEIEPGEEQLCCVSEESEESEVNSANQSRVCDITRPHKHDGEVDAGCVCSDVVTVCASADVNRLLETRFVNSNEVDKSSDIEVALVSLVSSPKRLYTKTDNQETKKKISPQKSNSSGNVRHLLSKFELSPTTERDLMELNTGFNNTSKDKAEGNVQAADVEVTLRHRERRSFEERPKTLERISTRRRTERDKTDIPETNLGKSKSGSQIDENEVEANRKIDVLINSGFDLSDPQRRERIERYKEKRRTYLREKYRSDSFKHEKDDFVLKIKQKGRKSADDAADLDVQDATRRLPPFEKPARKHLPKSNLPVAEKKSPEKRNAPFEKPARKNPTSKVISPTERGKDLYKRSFSVDSGSPRFQFETPTISSLSRDQARHSKSGFTRLSYERRSVGELSSPRHSPEKKSLSLDTSVEPASPRRRISLPKNLAVAGSLTSATSGASRVSATTPTSPPYCIKDMAAIFERRGEEPSTHKQYLSSV